MVSSRACVRYVVTDYRVHPKAKSLDPDGQPCEKQTVGLLGRRHVTPIPPLRHRGKEGSRIDERNAGVADPNETHTEYPEPGETPLWQLTTSALRELPVARTAVATGVSTAPREMGPQATTKTTDGGRLRRGAPAGLNHYPVGPGMPVRRQQSLRRPRPRSRNGMNAARFAAHLDSELRVRRCRSRWHDCKRGAERIVRANESC